MAKWEWPLFQRLKYLQAHFTALMRRGLPHTGDAGVLRSIDHQGIRLQRGTNSISEKHVNAGPGASGPPPHYRRESGKARNEVAIGHFPATPQMTRPSAMVEALDEFVQTRMAADCAEGSSGAHVHGPEHPEVRNAVAVSGGMQPKSDSNHQWRMQAFPSQRATSAVTASKKSGPSLATSGRKRSPSMTSKTVVPASASGLLERRRADGGAATSASASEPKQPPTASSTHTGVDGSESDEGWDPGQFGTWMTGQEQLPPGSAPGTGNPSGATVCLAPSCVEPKALVEVSWKVGPGEGGSPLRIRVQLYSGHVGMREALGNDMVRLLCTYDPQGAIAVAQAGPGSPPLDRFRFVAPGKPGGYTVCLLHVNSSPVVLAKAHFRVGIPLSSVKSLPLFGV